MKNQIDFKFVDFDPQKNILENDLKEHYSQKKIKILNKKNIYFYFVEPSPNARLTF